MTVFITIGGVGGAIALISAVVVVGRGIFKQISATEDNTAAVVNLTGSVADLASKYNAHETRLTVLEDRSRRS